MVSVFLLKVARKWRERARARLAFLCCTLPCSPSRTGNLQYNYWFYQFFVNILAAMQCCGAGARAGAAGDASFMAAPEPVLIFWSVGAESRLRLYKAAPAPAGSFRKAKKKSLALLIYKHDKHKVSRSRHFLPGAGDVVGSGPPTSEAGAAKKSGGSATLDRCIPFFVYVSLLFKKLETFFLFVFTFKFNATLNFGKKRIQCPEKLVI